MQNNRKESRHKTDFIQCSRCTLSQKCTGHRPGAATNLRVPQSQTAQDPFAAGSIQVAPLQSSQKMLSLELAVSSSLSHVSLELSDYRFFGPLLRASFLNRPDLASDRHCPWMRSRNALAKSLAESSGVDCLFNRDQTWGVMGTYRQCIGWWFLTCVVFHP